MQSPRELFKLQHLKSCPNILFVILLRVIFQTNQNILQPKTDRIHPSINNLFSSNHSEETSSIKPGSI